MPAEAYRAAFTDWLACASRGFSEPAARAASAAGDPIVALGTAGHVLDFDDTFLPGIAHLSAPVAPAALALGAHEGATVGDVLAAYADGFEAMGALAAAGHPALYDRGWHPTAVCGAVGAAVAAARLLGADADTAAAPRRPARRWAPRRVRLGREVDPGRARGRDRRGRGAAGEGGRDGARRPIAAAWEEAYGGRWSTTPQDAVGAQLDQGVALLPADPRGDRVRRAGRRPARRPDHRARPPGLAPGGELRRRRDAAPGQVLDPLHDRLHAPARRPARGRLRRARRRGPGARRAHHGRAPTTRSQESEFALLAGDEELARVDAARGSPQHPLSPEELRAKVHDLAGDRFDDLADDEPAAELIARI